VFQTFQNNTVEGMELKEIRLSPVLAIRNSQSFQPLDLDSGDNNGGFTAINPATDQSNLRMPAAIPRATYVTRPAGYFPTGACRLNIRD
jgi:hypothetical protein